MYFDILKVFADVSKNDPKKEIKKVTVICKNCISYGSVTLTAVMSSLTNFSRHIEVSNTNCKHFRF